MMCFSSAGLSSLFSLLVSFVVVDDDVVCLPGQRKAVTKDTKGWMSGGLGGVAGRNPDGRRVSRQRFFCLCTAQAGEVRRQHKK